MKTEESKPACRLCWWSDQSGCCTHEDAAISLMCNNDATRCAEYYFVSDREISLDVDTQEARAEDAWEAQKEQQ